MCYYNGLNLPKEEKIKLLGVERKVAQLDLLNPLVNGFDYGSSLVIKADPEEIWEFSSMEWGFLPSYLKTREAVRKFRFGYTENSGKFRPPLITLNAIGEEILKPGKMFREAALHRRCLIISSGFYEWQHVFLRGKKGKLLKTAIKYPYRITVTDKRYFFMAGIWQPWTDIETGETIETFAIVTTAANELMEVIHNSKKRMPVILPESLAGEWISENLSEERIKEIATYKMNASKMEAYTIQKKFREVDNPEERFEYPELTTVNHQL